MRQSVLIVDDNQDLLDLLQSILGKKGYAVETASCGLDGLRLLATIDQPDLLLLDVQMPDMTGPEFLNQVESQDVQLKCPVVYCTAGEGPEDRRACGYINKMADLSELIHAIESHLQVQHA